MFLRRVASSGLDSPWIQQSLSDRGVCGTPRDLTGSSAPSAGIQPHKKHNAGDVTNVARAFTRTRVTYSTVLIQLCERNEHPLLEFNHEAHG